MQDEKLPINHIFSHKNAVRFTILTYLVPVLFTIYLQGVLKLKEIYIFRHRKVKQRKIL